MIKTIKITGIAHEVDETTRKFITNRVGKLDRYLPKHATKSVSGEVKLVSVNHDHGNKYEAEIILRLPGKIVTAKGSTDKISTAIEAAEAKVQTQLREYKQSSIAHIGRRGIMSRFKRSFKREL